MQNALTPGTRVMTTTGLFATVVAIDADDVILEVAPGVETRWVKAAIGRVLTPVDDTEGDEADSAGASDGDEAESEAKAVEPQGDDQDSPTKKS